MYVYIYFFFFFQNELIYCQHLLPTLTIFNKARNLPFVFK